MPPRRLGLVPRRNHPGAGGPCWSEILPALRYAVPAVSINSKLARQAWVRSSTSELAGFCITGTTGYSSSQKVGLQLIGHKGQCC